MMSCTICGKPDSGYWCLECRRRRAQELDEMLNGRDTEIRAREANQQEKLKVTSEVRE